ncbi:MAG: efflux RND transporter periplasmic adaptor subunit, partial [Betaproteobacteria bacterium]|nr:efflux RND transporter periplasmic adaptor subunit [Betaproteobacteria bacterium]
RDLHAKGFISAAALDQAEAEFTAAEAGLNAQIAQAGVAHTQADFHILRAPYAGVVSEVPIVVGDLAQPGRPLITLVDPGVLRVTAQLVQSDARAVRSGGTLTVDIPGYVPLHIPAEKGILLPATEPGSQTMRLRLDLPAMKDPPAPGTFARVSIAAPAPVANSLGALPLRVSVPHEAVVKRAELTGVYVMREGQPLLRQVRLGGPAGSGVEVLSGLQPGDLVALDPQAAARRRQP